MYSLPRVNSCSAKIHPRTAHIAAADLSWRGCEGPEEEPVALPHRATGRQALDAAPPNHPEFSDFQAIFIVQRFVMNISFGKKGLLQFILQ